MSATPKPHTQRTLVAFYGDDFTGSSENLAQLCRTGLKGRLFFETADPAIIISEAKTLDVVGIAGTARALSPEAMVPALSNAFATLHAIGRNEFLAGALFTSSPHVDERPLVTDYQLGFTIRVQRLTLTYSLDQISSEYTTRANGHAWSRLGVEWRIER